MDLVPILSKILGLIQVLLNLEGKVRFHKLSCQTLVSCIKLLQPLLAEVQASEAPLAEEAVTSFRGLECALIKARELLELCGGKASRFYVVLRRTQLTMKFQSVSKDIEGNLCVLHVEALKLSNQAQEQVKQCLQELKCARYDISNFEEDLAEEIEAVLKELQQGAKIRHEKLKYLEGRFGLNLNQEILREASLLEKEKGHARVERDKVEEDCINHMIALVTQMSNDLSEQKQAEDELRGITVPADFRCPLSLELMLDPVIIASGQTYERVYIQQWLQQGNTTCPKTRQPLSHTNLIPNYTVKALIANWCESNNVHLPDPTRLNTFELQQELMPPLNSSELEQDNHGYFQEALNVPKTNVNQTPATSGNRPTVRSMRTIRSRVHEEQTTERVAESAFGTTEAASEHLQNRHTRSTVGRDADGRLATPHNVDHMADHVGGHSRNSSIASSIDDVQATIVSDENSLDVPQHSGASSCYNSELSGELERSAVSARSATQFEERGSPVRMVDRISASWRSEDHLSNVPRSMPLSGSDSAVVDGEDIHLKVEQLVEDLKSLSIEEQRNAAAELRLLAKYNMENRIIIAECGAIGPLVTLLHSTDPKTQENAVTALLNLSINDNNKNEIAAAGAIDPLVNVLKVGNSEAKENTAATLFSLSVMDENKAAIGQSGAVPPLVDLLIHGTPRGKKDAATALFNLSILHENKSRIVRAGAARPLVELMSDPAAGMVDKAVAVLANLATTQEGRFSIGEEGGIPALVEVVELGSQRGKENAAAALLQLCTNSNRFRAMVLQEGAIPPLVALSQSGTPRAKEKASALLRHFREQRHQVMGRGGPE
eukprot:c26645_g1_i1 orf=477-2975(+)